MTAEKANSRGSEPPEDHSSGSRRLDTHLTGAALRALIAARRAEAAISAAEMHARLEILFAEAVRRHGVSD